MRLTIVEILRFFLPLATVAYYHSLRNKPFYCPIMSASAKVLDAHMYGHEGSMMRLIDLGHALHTSLSHEVTLLVQPAMSEVSRLQQASVDAACEATMFLPRRSSDMLQTSAE